MSTHGPSQSLLLCHPCNGPTNHIFPDTLSLVVWLVLRLIIPSDLWVICLTVPTTAKRWYCIYFKMSVILLSPWKKHLQGPKRGQEGWNNQNLLHQAGDCWMNGKTNHDCLSVLQWAARARAHTRNLLQFLTSLSLNLLSYQLMIIYVMNSQR